MPIRISLVSLLLASLAGLPSLAQEVLAPRLQIGIGILPAVISANMRLASEPERPLTIYIAYLNNRHLAEQLQLALEKIDRIHRRELRVRPVSLSWLLINDPDPSGTIFIAEPMGERLDKLIAIGHRQRLLLFSPFEGDVERGVAAGFRVTDKVLPMVNPGSLKLSNIYLKAFFLRVAVKYE